MCDTLSIDIDLLHLLSLNKPIFTINVTGVLIKCHVNVCVYELYVNLIYEVTLCSNVGEKFLFSHH